MYLLYNIVYDELIFVLFIGMDDIIIDYYVL